MLDHKTSFVSSCVNTLIRISYFIDWLKISYYYICLTTSLKQNTRKNKEGERNKITIFEQILVKFNFRINSVKIFREAGKSIHMLPTRHATLFQR